MPKKKKSIVEKIAPIFTRYYPIMSKLLSVNRDLFYPVDYWTPLKLYCLASYIHTCYSKIISKRVTKNFYFIDLMASSGINFIEPCRNCEKKDKEESKKECNKCRNKEKPKEHVPGSTIIAGSSEPPFRMIYFIDDNPANIDTLAKRLDILKQEGFANICYTPIVGNCNERIDKILLEIKASGSKYHILAFADNEGLDIEWKTIEKLLTSYCDLIINFPSSNIRRAFYQPPSYETKKLNAFFGCDIRTKIKHHSELLPFYVGKIKKIKPKADVEIIHIETNVGFYYDLLIVAKKGPYWNYISALKKEIERNSAEIIEKIIPILVGKQKTLFGEFSK